MIFLSLHPEIGSSHIQFFPVCIASLLYDLDTISIFSRMFFSAIKAHLHLFWEFFNTSLPPLKLFISVRFLIGIGHFLTGLIANDHETIGFFGSDRSLVVDLQQGFLIECSGEGTLGGLLLRFFVTTDQA